MPNIHGVNAWRLLAYLKRLSRRDLEHTVWKVLNSIGFDIEEDRIEVCHWLTKSDRTIVKFSRSKDCQHLMRSKKGQKNLNLTSLNFPEGIKTYVNDSLCPCYSWLWNEFKKLWNNKRIYSYFTVNGTVRIKRAENGPYKSVTRVNDLRAIYFLRRKFSCLQLFRYLQAVLFLSNLCSFSIFLVFNISVMYLAILWQSPFFRALMMAFVICLITSFICSFCCSAALQCLHGVLTSVEW